MKKRITALILVICIALLLSPSMMASGNVYPLTARITGEGKIIAEDAAYEAGDEVEFILRPVNQDGVFLFYHWKRGIRNERNLKKHYRNGARSYC